ncbi:MAG TPA: hypothetical protein VFB90_02595 [Dehalococcoidia bacterium]|nr:hypothetical protein [Dehalococcoidia bacterium]
MRRVRLAVELVLAGVTAPFIVFDGLGVTRQKGIDWQWLALMTFAVFLCLIYKDRWDEQAELARIKENRPQLHFVGLRVLQLGPEVEVALILENPNPNLVVRYEMQHSKIKLGNHGVDESALQGKTWPIMSGKTDQYVLYKHLPVDMRQLPMTGECDYLALYDSEPPHGRLHKSGRKFSFTVHRIDSGNALVQVGTDMVILDD